MEKSMRKKVEAVVGPYIQEKCRGYAVKFGWSEEYERKAVRWCEVSCSRAVREKEAKGEKIRNPIAFCKYVATQSLKKDKSGKLIIPYWKKEIRTGSGVYATYAETKEEL